jgi:type II secretion system protein N
MDRREKILLGSGAVLWGLLVAALVVYLFFPYQKALKIALQNVVGGGKTAVAVEGVNVRTTGITASKLLLRPVGATGQTAPFELKNVDISWSPFSLFRGKIAINSKATVYDGSLWCRIDGVSFTGSANPNIALRLDRVNLGKCPEGTLPWFKGITGFLDGTLKKETPLARPDKQTGFFRFNLRGGEVKDLQPQNMPRLFIPYKHILIEGKIDGPRIDITNIALTSDVVSLKGKGTVETTEFGQMVDIRANYEVLSKNFPMKGKGTITISGNQASPTVAVSGVPDGSSGGAPVVR